MDACGAESSIARLIVSRTDLKLVVFQNCLRVVSCMLDARFISSRFVM